MKYDITIRFDLRDNLIEEAKGRIAGDKPEFRTDLDARQQDMIATNMVLSALIARMGEAYGMSPDTGFLYDGFETTDTFNLNDVGSGAAHIKVTKVD